ncbi:hypothetical protein [Allomuricauda sp. SCSIO 65647]|uniref:hypothetical protein n=1 Tax=Allomuricauda sp. SCSIO 65647 TaxID=2908843 RepID=UPI001F30FC7E|nr:hypothetical protein [Muricauda sp. SCSIO 65647]UJH69049.1 hypothetical protein L0P89_07495 [Muricauda sp. SCSIO 65647]
MAENSKNTSNNSDEIDFGQLFKIIGGFFQSLFNSFLRFFLYIRRNLVVLIALGVLGIAGGFALKQIVSERMKIEVIVRPNLESQEYLYDVVDEIQANIKAENQVFFDEMNINVDDLKGFKVSVVSLGDKNSKLEAELKFLELLKGLDVSGSVSDIVRNEILTKNSLNHKIIFSYKENKNGQEHSGKMMDYINSNPYFDELIKIYRSNAEDRIKNNTALIGQLDQLIAQYSKNLATQADQSVEGRIILDNEEQMDIRRLFDLKNDLIKDTESKKVELKQRTEAIRIINYGRPQEVIKPFFGKELVLLPLVLIGLFFLWSVIKYLNQKANELQ